MATSSDSSSLGVTLNANQRRHYGILITGLDATLDKVEAAVSPPPAVSGLARMVSDLPPAFVAAAPSTITRLRLALQRMMHGLGLELHPMSQRQTCRALLTSEINRVEESYSTHLRGYGAVDDSVGTVLDPILRDVRGELGSLVALLAAPHRR